MNKEAADKMAQVLRDAQGALVTMARERDKLASKCAAFERREEAIKVAAAMHEKGIRADEEFADLVEDLEKQASEGRLGEIARAVDMVGPDMSFGRTTNHDEVAGVGASAFEGFLMGSVG